MKKFLFVLSLLLIAISFYSCQNDEDLQNTLNLEYSSVSLDSDPLIANLKNLNDSLLQSKDSIDESRSISGFFKNLKQLAVIYADIKGAIEGAKLGFKWGKGHGLLSSLAGSAVFAAVMSAMYSAMAAITNSSSNMEQVNINFDQERVELAYVNSVLRQDLVSNELERCSKVKINIPQKNCKDYEAGIHHNITLRLILNEGDLYNYNLEDALSYTELQTLHSREYMNSYKTAYTNPEVFSLSYEVENPSKEDKVIQLFLDAYKDYVDNLDDVNDLINNYISIIEKDTNITDEEKSAVYSALSPAAFSSNYWYQKHSRNNE